MVILPFVFVAMAGGALFWLVFLRREPAPRIANWTASTGDDLPNYEESKGPMWWTEPDAEATIRLAKTGAGALPPHTIMEVFRRAVERRGNELALAVEREGKWKEWSWKQYHDDVMTAGRALIKLGFQRHGCVAIIGFNSPEWFIANVAAIAAGGKSAGIYTTNGTEACGFIAEHSEAMAVVVEDEAQLDKFLKLRDRLPALRAIVLYRGSVPEKAKGEHKVPVYDWEGFMEVGRREPSLQAEVDRRIADTRPGHCATLIYTSGTTGNPKGVMISHDNLTWTSQIILDCLPHHDKENRPGRSVSFLPLSHVAAQMLDIHGPMAFAAFRNSNHAVYFARPDALKGSLRNTLLFVRPTFFFGVPRVWEKFEEGMKYALSKRSKPMRMLVGWAQKTATEAHHAKEVHGSGFLPPSYWLAEKFLKKLHGSLGLDKADIFFSGAAPISASTVEYMGSLGIDVCELYGSSECTGPQTVSLQNYRQCNSVGPSLPGTELRIEHKDGRDKPGEGEIIYRGRHIMMGYLKDPEKTKAAIDSQGFYHSEDVGRVDAEGLLYITGRIKELLITAGGENVAPVPIEDEVKKQLPAVSYCMVIGDKRKFLTALLTLKTKVDKETGQPLETLAHDALEAVPSSRASTVADVLRELEDEKKGPWREYIQAGIDRANEKSTSRAQKVQKWAVLPVDFSIPGNELTPTLKLKRGVVSEKYPKIIEGLYKGT